MLLEKLSNARGVSGDEGAVRDILIETVRDHVDSYRVDALGSLICEKKAVQPTNNWPRRVMIAAHMDEIGFMITGFNSDGTLRIDTVGGIDNRVLLSKTVLIGDKAVPGVIGFPPIHLIPASARSKVSKIDQCAVDIGATSKDEAMGMVNLGDYVTFDTTFEALSDGELRAAKGKAFDDRVGCAILTELLRGEYAVDIVAVFTAQEEVGLRGARTSAFAVDPDVAFALEGTICDDMPNKKDVSPVTEMGKGPAFTFMDRSFIASKAMLDLLTTSAEEIGAPYQYKRAAAGGTDAGAIHLTHEGVPSVTVAVPCRYIHAPVSMLSLNDVDNTIKIMRAALTKLGGGLTV